MPLNLNTEWRYKGLREVGIHKEAQLETESWKKSI